MEHTLATDEIEVVLTTDGGTITSLKYHGHEYLWQSDPKVWAGQAPVLFPICGALRNGRATTLSGKAVELAKHGFARNVAFEFAGGDASQATMRLTWSPDLPGTYPFPFEFNIVYRVEGSTLFVSFEVKNTGEEDMPFFVGGHPAFRCPLFEGEDYTDYKLVFEKPEQDVPRVDGATGLIDVETRRPAPQTGLELPLSHELFASSETVYDNLASRAVTFERADGAHGARVTFPDMNHLVIWSMNNGNYVCIEPWTGLPTCSDEDDVLEHKRGCIIVKPGEVAVRGFAIELF